MRNARQVAGGNFGSQESKSCRTETCSFATPEGRSRFWRSTASGTSCGKAIPIRPRIHSGTESVVWTFPVRPESRREWECLERKQFYPPAVPPEKSPQTIRFYRTNEPYGEFSNFAKFPILLKGQVWPTTEHYFQAQKFVGTEYEEKVRCAKSASEAAQMGRDRSLPRRADWQQKKEEIMLDALRAKFSQHPELKTLLLSTDDALLVEHTTNDSHWADGGDGSGKNRLGVLLMRLRDEIRQA